MAGAVGMPRRRFTIYHIIGGLAWTAAMILAGYVLGGIPVIAAHVGHVTLALVGLSLMPAAWSLHRRRRSGRQPRDGAARATAGAIGAVLHTPRSGENGSGSV